MTESLVSNSKNKIKFVTLGCKVNTYETQGMREALERAGFEECQAPGEPCQFVVINTCTVTGDADRENRYWIRRLKRENAAAKIIVTGCYTERNRAEIEALPGVDLVVPNYDKARIPEYLQLERDVDTAAGCTRLFGSAAGQGKRDFRYAPLSISRFEGCGRAYLKIQDGCNHACSFCKVVLVRGRSRSRPLGDIQGEVERLRDAGYREIVFSGIQLGAYGIDLSMTEGLVRVLEVSARVEGIERLRLSSIEPTDVRPALIQAMIDIPQCCPHLHIPLQSGDDEILKRMNRRYTGFFYRDLVAELKSRIPDFCLTLDVMAGFPGEEDRHFENTVQMLKTVKPLKCHVFPYSRREGTRAARFTDCPKAVVRKRVERLLELNNAWGREVREAYLGRIFPVLVEKKSKTDGRLYGLTAHYLKAGFAGREEWLGRTVRVCFETLTDDIFYGEAVPCENQEDFRNA